EVEALAAGVMHLAGQPELRRRLGREARQRVERAFSARGGWEKLWDYYRRLLS
ncbi:MAG: glycosyltransferase family 1 protein, partial [Magnetococcales bacterium]|nr:glycosyltransferase family 1 protein [Magnetococcales bacterium]